MSGGPFLNIKAPKDLLDRLDDYRFATRKPSRAEPVRPGDPDYALVRARRHQPADAFPIGEIEARLARFKRARTR